MAMYISQLPPIPQVAPSLCPPSLTISLPLPPLPLRAERFKDRLVDEGYNPAYGARPLRRAIMRLLEDSMAERMLAGDISEGDSVIIDGVCPPHLVLCSRLYRWLSAGCVPVVGVVPARRAVFQHKPANTHTPGYPSPSLHTPPSRLPSLPAVDADGQISVLNGDKRMVSSVPTATGADFRRRWVCCAMRACAVQ